MPRPILIPVSELRRDIARLIDALRRTPDPLYITQRGCITAVLMAPQRYEELRNAAGFNPLQDTRVEHWPPDDRRTHSLYYGPDDWETARLLGTARVDPTMPGGYSVEEYDDEEDEYEEEGGREE